MSAAAAPIPVTPRTQMLRQKLAFWTGEQECRRAARLRRYMEQDNITEAAADFAVIAQMPDWLLLHETQQDNIANAVTILAHRPLIDRELSGARLQALATAIGDDVFDRLCDADISDCGITAENGAMLPRPEDLSALGWQIMKRSLPILLADRYPEANGDAQAAALVEIAQRICGNSSAEAAA